MAYLVHQCQHANSLINSTIFALRQAHFQSCPHRTFFDKDGIFRSGFKLRAVKASYPELCKLMKNNIHYKVLGGQCAQQTLKGVVESFSSFNQLLRLFFKGESNQPRMPHYRQRGGLAPISFPVQPLKFNAQTGECQLTITAFCDSFQYNERAQALRP